jgi:hypothetical protein
MAKYIIEIDEVKSCGECELWDYLGCCVNHNASCHKFNNYEKEIHKDCPLVKVEEK